MPELPEVETVKRILEKEVTGLTIVKAEVLYPRLIQTDLSSFKSEIAGRKITSLSRKGKYLIFHLSGSYALLVHFRMEGKFFHLPSLEENLNKHVSLYFTMDDGTYMIFNDVRKFGVMYLYKEEELAGCEPLSKLGQEPWDIKDPQYLLDCYKGRKTMMKEALLDQSVISGLGNIYADEVLFRTRTNPFMAAEDLNLEQAQKIVEVASSVLTEAIANHGSTIRTYHPAQGMNGGMQGFLQAYGHEGQPCPKCGCRMEKRYVGGRGTTYCPSCQHVMPSLAITGKIAVGKTQVLEIFRSLGCYTASADEMVHALYGEPSFLESLRKKFGESLFNGDNLDKKSLSDKMISDKRFRRSYESFIWSAVKDKVNDFLISHTDKITAIEIPLLFNAHMDGDFTYTIGVESAKQIDYLADRQRQAEPEAQVDQALLEKKIGLSSSNAYDANRKKLSYIIVNNGTRESLINQVGEIYSKIWNAYKDLASKAR
jgi:formamidopyrimidine-DNA glycosylase